MRITKHAVNDGVVRLAIDGEIDLATIDDLEEAIMDAVVDDHAAEVIVDLVDVTFCDASGIGDLVRARSAVTEHAANVQVINPSEQVSGVLALTGVLDGLTGDELF